MRGGLGQMVGRAAPRRLQPAPSRGQSLVNSGSVRGRTMRNAGPIKYGTRRTIQPVTTQVDQDVAQSSDGLRNLVGRVANRPRSRIASAPRAMMRKKGGSVKKYADGGKVSTGLQGIRTLARQLKEALDRDDKETAGRLIRRMEKLEPGSSKSLTADPGEKARGDKLATFAKGGKVKAVAGLKAKIHGLQKRFLEISDLLTTAEDGDANIGDLEHEADEVVRKLEALGASVPDVHDSAYRKSKE